MTRNRITTDELIDTLLSTEDAKEVHENIAATVTKWGGKRENAGRKAKSQNNILKFTKRLSEQEKEFIDYARSHNIDYEKLMQG